MKTISRTTITALCLVGMMLFPSCLEVETTSQINTDGSVLRTITFDDDSANIYRGEFPIPFDSTWQRAIQKVGEKEFRLTVSKLFPDVREMNIALKGTFGKTLQYQFTLDRGFRWFFTTYRFNETQLKTVQFDKIPMSDFLSSVEIEGWREHEVERKPYTTKGDSLALVSSGPRFEQWEHRNLFEAVFDAFLGGVKKLNNPLLSSLVVEQHKDTLFELSENSLAKNNIDTLRLIFAKVLKNPLVHKAWKANSEGFQDVKDKMKMSYDGSFVTNVIMPGLITKSNARTIEGNKATWRDYKDFARFFGYTMWVESREVNWWAVILTGIIVLAILVLLVASTLRRRNGR